MHYYRRYHQPRRRVVAHFDSLAAAIAWLDGAAA
nr:MAG TPA: SpoIIAA-like protein [Caudoviricetes sp.]